MANKGHRRERCQGPLRVDSGPLMICERKHRLGVGLPNRARMGATTTAAINPERTDQAPRSIASAHKVRLLQDPRASARTVAPRVHKQRVPVRSSC